MPGSGEEDFKEIMHVHYMTCAAKPQYKKHLVCLNNTRE